MSQMLNIRCRSHLLIRRCNICSFRCLSLLIRRPQYSKTYQQFNGLYLWHQLCSLRWSGHLSFISRRIWHRCGLRRHPSSTLRILNPRSTRKTKATSILIISGGGWRRIWIACSPIFLRWPIYQVVKPLSHSFGSSHTRTKFLIVHSTFAMGGPPNLYLAHISDHI
jgi:hypothetical protein